MTIEHAAKIFDYIAIAERIRTVNWIIDSNQTNAVKPV